MSLVTSPNITDPDRIYEMVLALHEGQGEEQSRRINARLILLLANHIGDMEVLQEAFEAAR